jgi:class 3 adenylate cyclase
MDTWNSLNKEAMSYRGFVGHGFDSIISSPDSTVSSDHHSQQFEQESIHTDNNIALRSKDTNHLVDLIDELDNDASQCGLAKALEEMDELDVDDDTDNDMDRMAIHSDEFRTLEKANDVRFYTTSILIVVAFICTLTVGIMAPKHEANRLEKELDTASYSLFHHIGIFGTQHLQSLAGVSRAVTSYSIVNDMLASSMSYRPSFPFVTDPLYSINTYNAKCISGLHLSNIVYSPFVNVNNLEEWSAYSTLVNAKRFISNTDTNVMNYIHTINCTSSMRIPYQEYDETTSILSPIWQLPTYGSTSSDINFNLASVPTIGETMKTLITNASAVFSLPISPENDADWNLSQELRFMSYEMSGTDEDGPFSLLTVPVFNYVELLVSELSETNASEGGTVVVGAITAPFQWISYLQNVFSESTAGVLVVLEFVYSGNESQYYSYQVDGSAATYLGAGDLHHSYFEDYHRSESFMQVLEKFASISSNPLNGINISTVPDSTVVLHIYPTAKLKKMLETSGPIAFTGTVMLIWFGITIVFILVGNFFIVQIDNVVNEAHANRQLVNMLFPREVQERMRHVGTKGNKDQESSLDAIQNIIGEQSGVALQKTIHSTTNEELPIADLFPSASVMFADLAGFTSWSAYHDPVDVFTMLEALFKAMDTVANRLGVFKIETIGDCYLCVTGLPAPRDDHARLMVLFACEVMRQVPGVMKELSSKLGDECMDLNLRVGIHSGPVTAGVLRGEKSRFQLFGDTVNTASRIESNGEKGRIQISNETAQELFSCGKGHWYVPRDGGIEAKGKGRLQTHWVIPAKVNCSRCAVSDEIFTEF